MTEPTRRCTTCGALLDATPAAGLCPGCLLRAGMDPPFPAEEMERLFPQLEIHELLGRGGMGAVYRARQRSLDREVAFKLLPSQLVEVPGFTDRFLREARALARLDHPHIVRVFDHGCADGHHFLVMEYVDGLNLRQLMRRRALSPAEALVLVPQICDALQYAHDQGVVHRDVKPENILVDTAGRVKMADFGLARLTGGDDVALTGTHQVMGTPQYMAPEQVEGFREVDHRADIYSLGIVFYEMLTGELPMGRFDPPSRRVAVDVRLDEVVLKALEKEPERRYQQAGEVKTAVEELDRPESGPAVPSAASVSPSEALTFEESENEGLLFALLCLALPAVAYMGVVWSGSWWPLALLFLPGAGVGSCLPGPPLDPNGQLFMALALLLTLGAIAGSMATLGSASPLWAVPLFMWGMACGKQEEERRLAARPTAPPTRSP